MKTLVLSSLLVFALQPALSQANCALNSVNGSWSFSDQNRAGTVSASQGSSVWSWQDGNEVKHETLTYKTTGCRIEFSKQQDNEKSDNHKLSGFLSNLTIINNGWGIPNTIDLPGTVLHRRVTFVQK